MPWYRKSWGMAVIIMAVILVFLMVVIGAAVLGIIKQNKGQANNVQNITAESVLTRIPTQDIAEKKDRPSFGNPNAKLVIVEFGDFQCHYCRQEFPIIRNIMNKYKNDILFIFRQFPVINENSMSVAQASLCAAQQGKFWQFHDKLYAQTQDIATEDLDVFAQQSGISSKDFTACRNADTEKTRAQEDYSDGISLGVEGTPTFFVNGHKIAGVVSADQWETIITTIKKALETNNK